MNITFVLGLWILGIVATIYTIHIAWSLLKVNMYKAFIIFCLVQLAILTYMWSNIFSL